MRRLDAEAVTKDAKAVMRDAEEVAARRRARHLARVGKAKGAGGLREGVYASERRAKRLAEQRATAPRAPDDIGCRPGTRDNAVLPWARGEQLARLDQIPRNATLPPYLSRQPRRCAILVDRHVHKNGGSSVRDLLLEHERMGHALYQGYTQMYWNQDYRLLRKMAEAAIAKGEAPDQLLLIEAHFGWVEMAQTVLPGLLELDKMYKRGGIDCPLVLMTRVREPLDYYLSFYRWGVAFRQRESPAAFGSNFIEWVERVPNLQSTMMIQSMAAMAAEYHVSQYKAFYMTNSVIGMTPEEQWQKLADFLDAFAIVGTMEHFDESLLLAHDLVGLPLMLYKRNRPNQKGGFKGNNKSVCPDMEKCREAVMKVAKRDHAMYDRYSKRFAEKLKELGDPFQHRVALYKQAIADVQPLWKKVPRKQYLCRYHPETSANHQSLKLPFLRCPIEQGGSTLLSRQLCQNVYAHRLFECPWQYVPNGTLSDSLGCWRPSSGFN